MQLADYLGVLGSGQATIVVDHAPLLAASRAAGFADVRHSSDFDAASFDGAALWFVTTRASQQRARTLWDGCGGIIVLMIDAKAGGDPAAVPHVLERLTALDPGAVVDERRRQYDRLMTEDLLAIRTRSSLLQCRIGEAVEIACDADELEPQTPYVLTELLKASIVNIEAPTSTFSLDGELIFDDLLFQANGQATLERHAPMLSAWRGLAAAGADNRLRLDGNRIVELILNGSDCTQQLLSLCAGKEWETNATECAIGVLDSRAEPTLNTVFHQTRRGLHIGLGMGEQLPFLDFCAPSARIEVGHG
jgi:hypothetical protein